MVSPNAPPVDVAFLFLDLAEGGAQRLSIETCRSLDRSRYRPHLVCLRGRGARVRSARDAGLSVFEANRLRRPWDLAAVPILARRLRETGVRIAQAPLYSRASPYARAAARLAGVPLIVGHEFCRAERPRRRRLVADRLLRPGTRFIATSAAQRRELEAEGVRPDRIEVVRSGIRIEDFASSDRSGARERLALPGDRPIVLVPARLHPMKGHGDLLEAVGVLLHRIPDVLVLCAGDGPLRSRLESEVRRRGLQRAVRLLGHREDVPTLLEAADAVALASRNEGLPSAILEAFAARRCVVATDVGGVGEIVLDRETGRLVRSRSPEALAGALADVLSSPADRREMEERAHRLVVARYRLERCVAELQTTWDRWLDELDPR